MSASPLSAAADLSGAEETPPAVRARRLAERFGLSTASRPQPGAELIPVDAALQRVLPHGGLQRGALFSLEGPGALTLALALTAEATREGRWCAVLGGDELGLAAVSALGIDFARLAVVDVPGGEWLRALAILLESVDLVVAVPDFRPAPREQARLLARIRERRAVVLLLDRWPGTQALTVAERRWEGLEEGTGRLHRCLLRLRTPVGERALWLPDARGGVSAAEDSGARPRILRGGHA